jgi:hypothetical protein
MLNLRLRNTSVSFISLNLEPSLRVGKFTRFPHLYYGSGYPTN